MCLCQALTARQRAGTNSKYFSNQYLYSSSTTSDFLKRARTETDIPLNMTAMTHIKVFIYTAITVIDSAICVHLFVDITVVVLGVIIHIVLWLLSHFIETVILYFYRP